MPWTQIYDPLGHQALSAVVAVVPLAALFALLVSGKLRGWIAAVASAVAAILLAVGVWRMPTVPALSAGLLGAAFALFPILWIVVAALWVHSLSVESGQFSVIRSTLASLSEDGRLQAIFIAFAFGSFLEGASGFGTPVAITAAMLVGLGFAPRSAAAACLLANSAPVAFAAAGVPVAVAAEVSGLDLMTISRITGRQLPFLALVVPLWLSVVLVGWRRSLEVWPAILTAGLCLAISQFVISNVSGPWITGVLSGLVTMAGLATLYAFWRPRTTWIPAQAGATGVLPAPAWPQGPHTTPGPGTSPALRVGFLRALRGWLPYLLMSILILLWGTQPVKSLLSGLDLALPWPLLHGAVLRTAPIAPGPAPFSAVWGFAIATAPGTAIFVSGILSTVLLPNLGARKAVACFGRTIRDLRFTIVTVCAVLATAYVMNYSGMSSSIGLALAATGPAFPAFSPLLGWIGVLVTGSDTSSNALFCSLQRTTAEQLGLNPSLMVAANGSGGVAGKMASPQSISVATASVGLRGEEGFLLRSTIGHSVAMALVVSAITVVQAYLLAGMLPS